MNSNVFRAIKTNARNAKFVELWANGNWGKSKSLLQSSHCIGKFL